MATKSIEQRFWTKVTKTDTCWLWTAGIMGGNGYGGLRFNGSMQAAHRIAWQLTHGPIPDSTPVTCVLHKCDVRLCVNPDHLFLGTKTDNAADKVAKGRQERGEQHHAARLTGSDVRAIRSDQRAQRLIASDYGVCQTHVSRIKLGTRWKTQHHDPPNI